MYSNFNYGFLFLAALVQANHISYGYNIWPLVNRGLWNNQIHTPNYDVQTNEILGNNYQTNEKVKVQVFYESLCPGCILGATEVQKIAEKLAPYLDIQTYPYGNAETYDDGHGHITFKCQHGPKECYGNKLHACAIDSIGNITSAIIFNTCMMVFGSTNSAADTCGRQLGVDSATIKACAGGERGTQLLKHYGEESKKVGFRYVPYVLINGVERHENHLMEKVCKAFTNPPPECQNYIPVSGLV